MRISGDSMSRVGQLLAATTATVALAGCGSASAPPRTATSALPATQSGTVATTTPSGRMSHGELITRLNAICAAGNGRIIAVVRQSGRSEVERLEAVLRIGRGAEPQLAALRPSAQDRPAFERYLQAFRSQLGFEARVISAASSGDERAAQTLASEVNPAKARVTAAKRLGAHKCAI